MRVRFDVNDFLVTWARTRIAMDQAGYTAWRWVLNESRRAMVEQGYSNRSGKLSASMHSTSTRAGEFAYGGAVVALAPYAAYVDDGSRPHRITAKNAKALRWFDGGRPVFARSVMHPGWRGSKFSREAVEVFERRITGRLENAINRAAQ